MSKREPTTEESLAAIRAMGDQFCQDLPRVVAAINDWVRTFADGILGGLAVLAPAIESVWQVVRDAYYQAGSPYGDTEDGVLRWMREQGALAEAEREAEYQRERTQMYLDMRARLGLTLPVLPAGNS